MAKYPRRARNATLTLTTKTQSGSNSFGEPTFSTSTSEDEVVLQFRDRLDFSPAGTIRYRELTALTDPLYLSPKVDDEAEVNGVTYRISEVIPTYWKGIKIMDRAVLQERG